MKIKNLNVTKTGIIIFTSATIALCSGCGDIKTNNEFDELLEQNNIVAIKDLGNVPEKYYEVLISDPIYDNGPFHFDEHWEHIDSINHTLAIGRECDADYIVLKIDYENGKYVAHQKTIEDIEDRPEGYDYVFKDDYIFTIRLYSGG